MSRPSPPRPTSSRGLRACRCSSLRASGPRRGSGARSSCRSVLEPFQPACSARSCCLDRETLNLPGDWCTKSFPWDGPGDRAGGQRILAIEGSPTPRRDPRARCGRSANGAAMAGGARPLAGVERRGARPVRGTAAVGAVSPRGGRSARGARARRARPRPRHGAAPAPRPARRPSPARRARHRCGPVR